MDVSNLEGPVESLSLYPFQAQDAEFFAQNRRAMVLYEMRLGKTVVSLNVMARTNPRVVIIRCPQNALYVWRDHINTWWPHLTGDTDYEIRLMRDDKKGGYAQDRANKWSAPLTRKTTFFICTYAAFIIDSPKLRLYPNWLVNDEAKRLRSSKSKIFEAEKPWAKIARDGILFLEGTPTKRGPIDFFTMLHLADPKRFSSYWNFMEHFYSKAIVPGGAEPFDVDTLENMDHWYEILERMARVRFRKDVRPEMPPTTRQIIPIQMDQVQESLYRTLDEVRYAFTENGELILAQTTLEGLTRMRQILTCPKILDKELPSYGQAIVSFADTVDDMAPEERTHLVVYTAFRAAVPFFEEYLRSRGYGRIFRLHGRVDIEEGYQARQEFYKLGGIMLCTSRYAEAFSLEPATSCYHIGCEYDPNTNRQAEDRLVPQRGTNPIYSGYITYEGTHDQRIIEILDGFQRVIDATLKATL